MQGQTLSENEYFEQRLESQISWYSKNSTLCQNRYKALRIVEVVAASFVPLLSGFGSQIPFGPWLIAILGVLIAVCSAISGLFKYHENWIQYRSTAEALKHEKFLYLVRVAPYDDANRLHSLVQRVEALISKENSTWTQQLIKVGKKEAL